MTLSAGFRQQKFQGLGRFGLCIPTKTRGSRAGGGTGELPEGNSLLANRSHLEDRVGRRRRGAQKEAWPRVGWAWPLEGGRGRGSWEERPGRRHVAWSRPEGGVGPAGTSEAAGPECRKGRACAPGRSEGGSAGAAVGTTEQVYSWFPLAFFSQSHPENRKVQDPTDGQTHPLCPTSVWPRGRQFLSGPRPLKRLLVTPVWTSLPKVQSWCLLFGGGDTLPWGRRDSKGRVLRS